MSLDQTATGKRSTAGWLMRKAPQPPSHGSGARNGMVEPRGRRRGPRRLRGARAGSGGRVALSSSGSERATKVPAPTRLSM